MAVTTRHPLKVVEMTHRKLASSGSASNIGHDCGGIGGGKRKMLPREGGSAGGSGRHIRGGGGGATGTGGERDLADLD